MLILKKTYFCVTVLFLTCAPFQTAFAAKLILILGDSLSAGYGINKNEAWPTLLQQRLLQQAKDYKVLNASISGETSAGGKARIAALLTQHQPSIVIIALGANDGLRGLSLKALRSNLHEISSSAQKTKASTLIIGMRLPPNFGSYGIDFYNSFVEVARSTRSPLIPFLLEGIAEQADYFQADALHPNSKAQSKLLDNVWPTLAPLLERAR